MFSSALGEEVKQHNIVVEHALSHALLDYGIGMIEMPGLFIRYSHGVQHPETGIAGKLRDRSRASKIGPLCLFVCAR